MKSDWIPATNDGNDDPEGTAIGRKPLSDRHVFDFTIVGDVEVGTYPVPSRLEDDFLIVRVTGDFDDGPTGQAMIVDVLLDGDSIFEDVEADVDHRRRRLGRIDQRDARRGHRRGLEAQDRGRAAGLRDLRSRRDDPDHRGEGPELSTPPLFNGAEGGTDETTVTETNSGGASGDTFDLANVGPDIDLVFDNDGYVADGDWSYRLDQLTAGFAGYGQVWWTFDDPVPALTASMCLARNAFPTGTDEYLDGYCVPSLRVEDPGGGEGSTADIDVFVNTDGTLLLVYPGTEFSSITTSSIPTGQMCRIEVFLDASTNGVRLRLFNDAHGTMPEEVLSFTTDDMGGAVDAAFGNVLFQSDETDAGVWWMDNLRIDPFAQTARYWGVAAGSP